MATTERLLAGLRTETAKMTGLLAVGPLDAWVPNCPDWTLRDLGMHVGNVHVWATANARGRGERAALVPVEPGKDLAEWYAGEAAEMLAVMASLDPHAPAWGFGPKPRTAAFWIRRQLHETAVHRWDAEAAIGRTGAMEADLAADGVDEVLTVFLPRQVALERIQPLTMTVALECDGRRWLLGPDGPPVATVSGPAGALLLLLWRRIPLSDTQLSVDGDRAAAEQALAAAVMP